MCTYPSNIIYSKFNRTRFHQRSIGQIGDVIGGTTAPFIGLFGAILIYISFQEQVKANKRQIKANKLLEKETNRANFFKVYDTVVELIEFIIKQYDKLIAVNGLIKLDKLIETSANDNNVIDKNKHTLKKYRCVLELVSQCCDNITNYEVPTKKMVLSMLNLNNIFIKSAMRAV